MRIRTIGLIVTLILGLLAAPLPADAQQAGRVYRIGFITWGSQSTAEDRGWLKAFREELRDLGWVEGQNLMIEYRFAEKKAERLPGLVAELAGLQLDLIVTINTTITRAATKVIKTTPIVFTVVADPVASGFVASLARPGGNATGPSVMAPQLAGKRLELLKEVVPELSRIAVFWEPTNPGVALTFQQTQRDAQQLGLTLQSLEVRSHDDFAPAFAAMTRELPDALMVNLTPLTFRNAKQIAAFARKYRLPTMGSWGGFPLAGGLMSYAPNFLDNFRRVAPYVDKILKGAKPADLPVEQPVQFDLVIHLKTAEVLGLTIPPTLLLQADKVIR
jgi:putative ABC transport system substrate-binding protein